jgi:hypothetical protein
MAHTNNMKKLVAMSAGVTILFISAVTVFAQAPAPATGASALSSDQLTQLVGPIALYPDPLIAEILPAATYPSEVVLADRYASQGGDPNQVANQGWDPSIQAMAHYPNVLKWMDDNLTWTTQLGQAFEVQQADVMNAIQQLRAKAQSLGNLPSTPQETVVADSGDIEIEPTDPDQMYVPDYQPDQIYFQPGIFCAFPYWLPLGGWLVYDWNWHNHGLWAWGLGHPRPIGWWHQSPGQRRSYYNGHQIPTWHAGAHPGDVARLGWQRGFETANRGSDRSGAPLMVNVHPAPISRQPAVATHIETGRVEAPRLGPRVEAPRADAQRVAAPPREEFHPSPAPASGLFGGQTGHEAVESSSRGQASRAEVGGGAAAGGGGRHR